MAEKNVRAGSPAGDLHGLDATAGAPAAAAAGDIGRAPRPVIPFICHLFHRPAPERLADGRVLWRCNCGAVWTE